MQFPQICIWTWNIISAFPIFFLKFCSTSTIQEYNSPTPQTCRGVKNPHERVQENPSITSGDESAQRATSDAGIFLHEWVRILLPDKPAALGSCIPVWWKCCSFNKRRIQKGWNNFSPVYQNLWNGIRWCWNHSSAKGRKFWLSEKNVKGPVQLSTTGSMGS